MREVTGDDIKLEDYVRAHIEVCPAIQCSSLVCSACLSYQEALCIQQVKSASPDHEFETMYAELRAWRDAYGTTLVPKQVSRQIYKY